MKAHSNEYKTKIKDFGRQLSSKIYYNDGEQIIELGMEQLNSITPHYEGAILKSVMKQLDIDSNVDIPLGTIINYQFGIFVDKYYQTEDETYQADVNYYILGDDGYTLLIAGTDYQVGDNITDIVYNYQDYEYINFNNYIVYSSEKQEDTNSYKIVCYDKMLYSMIDYNNTGIIYPITIRSYINAICNKLGLTFKNANSVFANYNKEIPRELYLDSGGNSLNYKFRDVLDELAQVTASTICINDNDQLELKYITETNDVIDEEYLKDINVNFGQLYGPINTIVLSRSADTDKIYKSYPDDLPEEDRIAIEIKDNQIMNGNNRDTYLPDILNQLNGLEYYLNDYVSPGITYYDLCDKYTVLIGENTYSCVMFNNEINVTQGLEELVHTDMPEESQTDYSKADKTDRRINQTYLIVDKQNQVIEGVVSQVSEQDEQIASIRLQYNELISKISDIADITVSGDSFEASVDLDDVNASQPISIKIKPIVSNISYLYPNSSSYPTTQYLKARTLRFTNKDEYEITTDLTYNNYNKYYSYSNNQYTLLVAGTDYTIGNTITGTIYQNKVINWILPTDLWYYDSEHYDELELSYGDGVNSNVIVTRKCKINAQGEVELLQTPTTETYDYPSQLLLTDGDYNISLTDNDTAYLYVQLMAKNIYTTQFYTKAETNSIIDQTANNITLQVNQTLSNYSTTDEMNSAISITANEINSTVSHKVGENEIISKINQSPEQISINANKLSLAGKTINMTSDNIAISSTKFNVDKNGNMSCSNAQITGGKLTVGNNFSVSNTGILNCTNANVSGTVNASSGTFGGTLSTSENCTVGNNLYVGQNQSSSSDAIKYIYMASDGYLRRWIMNNKSYMRLNGDYQLNLTTNSSYIYISGDGYNQIQMSTTPSYGSDIRLKENIEDISVNWIDDLKLKQFNYKNSQNIKEIGLIAQDYLDKEYQKYFISKFDIDGEDYYGIKYQNITNALIQYCQELKQKVNDLEARIEKLERESDK